MGCPTLMTACLGGCALSARHECPQEAETERKPPACSRRSCRHRIRSARLQSSTRQQGTKPSTGKKPEGGVGGTPVPPSSTEAPPCLKGTSILKSPC